MARGQKSNWTTGAIIGGAVLGAASLAAVIGVCDPGGNPPNCSVTGGGILAVTAAGAVVGAVIGAALGSQSKSDRWEELPLDRLRVSFAPQRDRRFGLGLSVRF